MTTRFTRGLFSIAAMAILLFNACEKDSTSVGNNTLNGEKISLSGENKLMSVGATSPAIYPYQVVLEAINNNGDGTFTWTWSVQNLNPGKGTDGTVQDLSHWGITLGQCAKMGDIVNGSTSMDGLTWTGFTPVLDVDKSQSCTTDSLLKFDVGTSGSQKSYYRLTINKDLNTDLNVTALYKSGKNTGCGVFVFPGFGCPKPVGATCSMSQGFWFASKESAMTSSKLLKWTSAGVKVGGFKYSEAEGRAIWNASNKGGIADSKSGFHQVAAIKLSGVSASMPVMADVAIVEAWLSGLGKLSPANLPTGNKTAKAAAGRIGAWIDANHCE